MKTRCFPDRNYKAFFTGGRTIRLALDPTRPIGELDYPEFFDVKVTSHCGGNCSYCYQSSTFEARHVPGVVERFQRYFSRFDDNQMPFQVAFGGGEPTSHPRFGALLRMCAALGMVPNYTSNGTWVGAPNRGAILADTRDYCGGVAVSTHPHLDADWRAAVALYLREGIHTNLHVIIGDRASIDRFARIYRQYTGRVKYFVLLPLAAQGRSTAAFDDWRYLCDAIKGSPRDVAFGAGFHSYLATHPGRFNVSIYEPESMSAYLDLETMRTYKSSFSNEERLIGARDVLDP